MTTATRKNILILAHSTQSQFIDIYNQYIQLFAKDQYLVSVMYINADASQHLIERTLAEKVIFANQTARKLRYLKLGAVKELLTLCRQHHYDMVICHRYKPAYLMLLVAQFCKIPRMIFVMHAIGTMRSWRRRWFIKAMWQKNMLFAGVSNAVRDDLRQALKSIPAKQIVTLYNAIDVNAAEQGLLSRQAARSKLGIDESSFVFGHVGRFEANKDQANLIRAFAQIAQACPQAKLVMVGDGIKDAALKSQAAASGVASQICFTGRIADASCFMKAFDCFVLSSSQEAFGRVLLEAMVAKVPLIGTAAFGIPEVIGTAGTIVPIGDSVKLAAGMKEMYQLSAQDRAARGLAAYEQMVNHFSMPVFMAEFHEKIARN